MYTDITHLTNTKDWRDNADKFHKDARLCYVDYFIGTDDECDCDCPEIIYVLYFTTIPLNDQWGDDWDNAEGGMPDDFTFDDNGNKIEHEVFKVRLRLDITDRIITPNGNYYDTYYSPADINSGNVAWMYIPHTFKKCDGISVHAGDTISEALEKLEPHIIFGAETDTPYYSFE